MEQKFSHKEQDYQRNVRDLERDKKKMLREFEQLKQLLTDKERGVKSEIEKVWNDWEDRCGQLEAEKRQLEYRLDDSDLKVKELCQSLQQIKKENKQMKMAIEEREQEIRVITQKYEAEIQNKEAEVEEVDKRNKKNQEYLEYEIQHLKKELEK